MVRFPQPNTTKPSLGQFRAPLLHTFLVASTAYIGLHTVWAKLEYDERKRVLERESNELEGRILELVNGKRKWWWFW